MLSPPIVNRLTCIHDFYQSAAAINSVPGWLHELEGYALMTLAAHDPAQSALVEIGAFKGRSTCWLALGAKARAAGGKVHAIDHFTGSPEHQPGGTHPDPDIASHGSTLPAFRANIARLNLGDFVEPIVSTSLAAAPAWSGGPIRLLFIDGDHSYEASQADHDAWRTHITPGGLIAFHDVGAWEGVSRFFEELMSRGHSNTMEASVNSLRVIRVQG